MIDEIKEKYLRLSEIPKHSNALIAYLSMVNKYTMVLDKDEFSYNIKDILYFLEKTENSNELRIDSQHENISNKISNFSIQVLDIIKIPYLNLNRIDKNGHIHRPDWLKEFTFNVILNSEYLSFNGQEWRYLLDLIENKKVHNFELENIFFLFLVDKDTIDFLNSKVENSIHIV